MILQTPEQKTEYLSHQVVQAKNVIEHTQSREVAVMIPLAQAVFFAALPTAGMTGVFCLFILKLDLLVTLVIVCIMALAVFALDGRARLGDVRSLVWSMESVFHLDLDLDGQAGAPAVPASVSRPDQVVRLARDIVDRYYLLNQDITREGMEAAGLCTQDLWNSANELLKRLGIKGEKKMIAPNYQTAINAFIQRVRVHADRIEIRRMEGSGSEYLH